MTETQRKWVKHTKCCYKEQYGEERAEKISVFIPSITDVNQRKILCHTEVFFGRKKSNPQFNIISKIDCFRLSDLHVHVLCRNSLISFALKFGDAYVVIMIEKGYHCEKFILSEEEWLPYLNTNRIRMMYTIWLQLLLTTLNLSIFEKKYVNHIYQERTMWCTE